jgi:hypothetical protein
MHHRRHYRKSRASVQNIVGLRICRVLRYGGVVHSRYVDVRCRGRQMIRYKTG